MQCNKVASVSSMAHELELDFKQLHKDLEDIYKYASQGWYNQAHWCCGCLTNAIRSCIDREHKRQVQIRKLNK